MRTLVVMPTEITVSTGEGLLYMNVGSVGEMPLVLMEEELLLETPGMIEVSMGMVSIGRVSVELLLK
jgi:hypothetical protein